MNFEKIFSKDKISKLERVNRTMNHQPVDRVALHDQVSFNPGVIELYTGKKDLGFNYTENDICEVIRKTLDMCFPPHAPYGKKRVTDEYGFVRQNDDWTSWIVSRPFQDEKGAAEWLRKKITRLNKEVKNFNPKLVKEEYKKELLRIQRKIGDTVICRHHDIGLCQVWSTMDIEIFSYFYADYPDVMDEYIHLYILQRLKWIEAVADYELSPIILIADDFASKNGSLFGEDILLKYLFDPLTKITKVWKEHGYKVLFHSDGNWKKFIPNLINTGVDGFYCLEPACGMDIVELKKQYSQMVWAGGLDGVDLMERGTPEQVRQEVIRHITETNVLQIGGMFLASSSEINPPIKPENFKAMIDTAGEYWNKDFFR